MGLAAIQARAAELCRSPRARQQAAGALLALVLHGALLKLLLTMTLASQVPQDEHETLVTFLPSQKPEREPPHRASHPGAAAPQTTWSVPFLLLQPNVVDLGQMLSDCRPEKLDMLSDEQRTRCNLALGGPADGRWTAYSSFRSRSRYRALWQAALAKRLEPLRIPCTFAGGGNVAPGSSATELPPAGPPVAEKSGVGVSYICIGLMLWKELNR